MKKFFSKFLKDTRGVVMMEYIILGCFAVAITVCAVLALGKVYNNGLITMAYATLGATEKAVQANIDAEDTLESDVASADAYITDMIALSEDGKVTASTVGTQSEVYQ